MYTEFAAKLQQRLRIRRRASNEQNYKILRGCPQQLTEQVAHYRKRILHGNHSHQILRLISSLASLL
jgi:hypothetical protein